MGLMCTKVEGKIKVWMGGGCDSFDVVQCVSRKKGLPGEERIKFETEKGFRLLNFDVTIMNALCLLRSSRRGANEEM